MKAEDVAYIFTHGDAEAIIVDHEFLHLLDTFRLRKPTVPIIVDTDVDAVEGQLSGPFDDAIFEGLAYDTMTGGRGWDGLEVHPAYENSLSLSRTRVGQRLVRRESSVHTGAAILQPWAI